MKVPHLMSIRPMECWLATQNASSAIMSHALEQINAARTGVISQSASSKLSASCLNGCSVSLRNIQGSSTFFIRGDVRNTSVTIHTLVEKCPFSFRFWTWCGDFQFREELIIAHAALYTVGNTPRTLSSKRGLRTGTSWELTYLPLASMKVTHLMSLHPKLQEARETLKKTRSLCVVCGLLAMFRNRQWQFWDLPLSVKKSTNMDP